MTVGLPPITTQHNRSRGGSNSSSPTYDNVLVGVRCRPLFPESDKTHELAWQLNPLQQSIQLANNNSNSRRYPTSHVNLQTEYHYDRVYYESSNEQVYQDMVLPLIQQTMDGYNATVFTYGQTASGKTHTMMGTDLEPGIIPQAVNEVFNCIKQSKNNEFLLRVSYLEIYNETIRDLLAPENDNLKIYEDPHRGTYVGQATEKVVTNPHEVMDTILCGETNRHISTTDYNLHSSRSHTLFQMVIESRQSGNTPLYKSHSPRAKASVKISQLNLIDLAGSEKAASNQDRRKEGAYINKSLLTLGTVIAKLTEPGKSAGHVPYRDSKLTRLLQSSLSGSARVVVICTISPTIFTVDESINTLKFASRVKKIVLRAKNEPIADDKTLLQQYKSEIDELKKKLQVANDGRAQEQQNNETMLSHERQQYEQELFQMRLVRTALKERIDHLTKLILTSTSANLVEPQQASKAVQQLSDDDLISPPRPPPKNPSRLSQDSASPPDNPWTTVRDLRRQVQELKQTNNQLRLQIDTQKESLEAHEIKASQHQRLMDKIAQLEAELSVTKAELEVISMVAKEATQENQLPASMFPSVPANTTATMTS